jgi:hypothetical protein
MPFVDVFYDQLLSNTSVLENVKILLFKFKGLAEILRCKLQNHVYNRKLALGTNGAPRSSQLFEGYFEGMDKIGPLYRMLFSFCL